MERMSTEFGGLSATDISLRWSVIREICVIHNNPRFRQPILSASNPAPSANEIPQDSQPLHTHHSIHLA